MRCHDFQESLATLAEGGAAPEAEAHVAACGDCRTKLARLEALVQAARLPMLQAPADLVARAQALMAPRPRLVARLLGNGLAASGARRSGNTAFFLSVGTDDATIPLQYAPTKDGWEILGRAPSEEWTVEHNGTEVPCVPGGRFRLNVPSLEEAGFVLRCSDLVLEVPSASDLTGHDA